VIWLTNTPPSGYSNVKGKVHYVANDLYTSLSNTKVYPYLSSIFEVGGIKYVPVSPSDRTCDAIDCIYTGEPYNVEINDNVSYKGIDLTVKAVNPYIGYECTKIKKVNISLDGDIESSAFYNCDSLSSVTITKANDIGSWAFSGCYSLTELSLDSKIKSLGQSAFSGCNKLQGFSYPELTY